MIKLYSGIKLSASKLQGGFSPEDAFSVSIAPGIKGENNVLIDSYDVNIGGKTLNVPDTIGGQYVTIIGNSSYEVSTNIKKLIVNGEMAKKIGNGAFANCTTLKSVRLRNVSEIGLTAFRNCRNLQFFRILYKLWKN